MNSTLLSGVEYLLTTANVPLALFCFIMAGFQLRGEGGINFDANGSFFRWMAWGAVLLTLPDIAIWLTGEGVGKLGGISFPAGAGTVYTLPLSRALTDFVYNIVLARLVPVMAGALVIKALADSAEGHTPLPSIFSAIFLLGISGFWATAQGWVASGSAYGTTDFLSSLLAWAMTTVCPILGVICIYGAIIEYVKGGRWIQFGVTGVAFLAVGGIWTLVQSWVGVTGIKI